MTKLSIVTDYPLAVDSYDHLHPKGTMVDNLHSTNFVEKVIEKLGSDIAYLDLGTAGGGLVKDFLDKGILAAGIDGSDYSRINQRAEWPIIPDSLFTADITKPFYFIDPDEIGCISWVRFDIISSFDVLEHIREEDLYSLIHQIRKNLKPGGYFLASIAEFEDEGYHVTLKPEQWWIELFEKNGFIREELIDSRDYARTSSHNVTFKKI